jgi:hypothetical protein
VKQEWITGLATVLIAIVGLAIIAVLVSPNAQTGNVLGSLGSAIQRLICIATSPVTGASCGGTSVTSTITFGGGPV